MFQTSTLLSYCCFCTTSGEEYKGVPHLVSLKRGECIDHPKSHTFTMFYILPAVPRAVKCSRVWYPGVSCPDRAWIRWHDWLASPSCGPFLPQICPVFAERSTHCHRGKAQGSGISVPSRWRRCTVGLCWGGPGSSGSSLLWQAGLWSGPRLQIFFWGFFSRRRWSCFLCV